MAKRMAWQSAGTTHLPKSMMLQLKGITVKHSKTILKPLKLKRIVQALEHGSSGQIHSRTIVAIRIAAGTTFASDRFSSFSWSRQVGCFMD